MAGLDEGQQIPETISFQGNITYLLNDLITYDRAFFVGCIKNVRITIRKKNIPEDQYWFATYSKKTSTWSPAIPENYKAKVLISEEWVNNNVPKFTGDQGAYKYKPLPPLLELSESEKFRDDQGNIHEVEVRGEKTKDGIRFKCKDIARVFEMESLDHNIRNIVGPTEYEVFCSDKPIDQMGLSEQNKGGNPTSTYLTYNGLLKVIFASRSGIAYRFQDWATRIIYAAHLGTTEERVDVVADIIGVNAQMVKDVLTACITSMPCVYLFNVGKITELRKHHDQLKPFKKGFLFKWGRTNDLRRRTGEHIKDYGNLLSSTLKLKYFSPVDNIYEASAEAEIRKYFHAQAVSFGKYKELVILDKSQIADARRFYEDVYKKFSSEVDRLLGKTSELEKDAEYMKHILKMKDEKIEELNKACEDLREQMFEQQQREEEYKSREEEYRKDFRSREEEYRKDFRRREEEYRKEIDRRRQRSGEHRREMDRMMDQLSNTTQQNKQYQDMLSKILTPDQCKELADRFAASVNL